MDKQKKAIVQEKTSPFNAKGLGMAAAVVVAVALVALVAANPTGFAALLGIQGPEEQPGQPNPVVASEIKTFTDSGKALELEGGKPVIRLFSTTWCPHCKWVGETFEKVAKEYEGRIVARHWEFDTGDDTLSQETETSVPASEQAVFSQFSPSGGVPTFVFGGKYVRIGNGYEREDSLAKEEAEFRAVIEALLKEAGQ